MTWKALLQSIATHLLFGVVMFWVGWFAKPPPETTTIDLTESQRQQIIQDARIGWITLDSAKAMINMKSRIRWIINYRDSVVIRDSINIKDSVVFIPVYEANDTTIYFNRTTPKAKVSLAMKLKQRFFPLQEKFASDLQLMSLTIDMPEPEIKTGNWFTNFFEHRFIIYIGGGLNYFNRQVQPGIQIGAGIRLL